MLLIVHLRKCKGCKEHASTPINIRNRDINRKRCIVTRTCVQLLGYFLIYKVATGFRLDHHDLETMRPSSI